jgi:phosphoglycolate phosphatase
LIHLVAFDANGTLLDDAPALTAALNSVFRALGRPALPRAELVRRLGVPWTDLYRDLGVSRLEASDAELGRLYREAYLSGPTPTLAAGARTAVQGLRDLGLVVSVLSAQEEALTRSQLAFWPDLLAGLAEIRGGVDDKVAALGELATQHGLRPQQMAYVGDQVSDMVAARASGVMPIGRAGGLAPAAHLRRAGAKAIVTDLAQIVGLIAAINSAT